jgi:short-subunit dehydrogenase
MGQSMQRRRGTALVTGASGGIGLELARLLAADGFDLVLVARDRGKLADAAAMLRDRFGAEVHMLPADLSRPDAVANLHAKLREQGINVSVLVNNAGFDVYGPFWRTDAKAEHDLLQVNVVALMDLTKALLPDMRRAASGRILNVASTAAFAPCPWNAVYGASKAFVLSFSHALAEELSGSGVTVTALCPGPTDTGFARRAGMARTRLFEGPVAKPASVARAGYRAMMRGRRSVVAGFGNRVMVQVMRCAPARAVARVSAALFRTRDAAPDA